MIRKILITLVAAVALVIPLANRASASADTCNVGLGGVCGAYYDPSAITWSNGFNTYVTDQDVGCGGDTSLCNDQLTVTSPTSWSLTSNMNDSATNCNQVHTYPDVNQLTNEADGSDIALSNYKSLRSTFSIASPAVGSYEAAYDIWFSQAPGQEVMIWVDTQNHDHGGHLVGSPTFFGQAYQVYTNGPKSNPGEIVVKLDSNELSGTVHIKAVANWLTAQGWIPAGETIGQINFGWEICGTGGTPQTFTLNSYSLTGVR